MSYLLRSYLICDLCNRRMFDKARVRRGQETIYHACVTNPEHHQEQPWYTPTPHEHHHQRGHLLPVVGKFFGERILGPQRALYLNHREPQTEDDSGVAAQRAALRKQLDQLGRALVSRATAGVSEATLRLPSGEEITLPESLVAVLIASAGQLSQGHGVTVLLPRSV